MANLQNEIFCQGETQILSDAGKENGCHYAEPMHEQDPDVLVQQRHLPGEEGQHVGVQSRKRSYCHGGEIGRNWLFAAFPLLRQRRDRKVILCPDSIRRGSFVRPAQR